jgi:hypothetical protein
MKEKTADALKIRLQPLDRHNNSGSKTRFLWFFGVFEPQESLKMPDPNGQFRPAVTITSSHMSPVSPLVNQGFGLRATDRAFADFSASRLQANNCCDHTRDASSSNCASQCEITVDTTSPVWIAPQTSCRSKGWLGDMTTEAECDHCDFDAELDGMLMSVLAYAKAVMSVLAVFEWLWERFGLRCACVLVSAVAFAISNVALAAVLVFTLPGICRWQCGCGVWSWLCLDLNVGLCAC